jgi:hypothetical protein
MPSTRTAEKISSTAVLNTIADRQTNRKSPDQATLCPVKSNSDPCRKRERSLRPRYLLVKRSPAQADSRNEKRKNNKKKTRWQRCTHGGIKAKATNGAELTGSSEVPPTASEKRHQLLEREQQEKRRLAKEYGVTGDQRVFAHFLRPFLPTTELTEWRWDGEVQRWWREDKSTGERLWSPVDASFI